MKREKFSNAHDNDFRLKPYESDSDDEDYNVDFDETKLPPIEIPPGDHKLQVRCDIFFKGI